MLIKKRKPYIRSSDVIPLFCGSLIKKGNKFRAYKILIMVLKLLRYKLGKNPFFIIESVIRRIRPIIFTRLLKLKQKKRKRVMRRYTKVMLLSVRKSNSIAIKWLISTALKRHEKNTIQKLYAEILLLYSNKGVAYKKKHQLYSIISNNRSHH